MTEYGIRISQTHYERLINHLFPPRGVVEQGAFMLAGSMVLPQGKTFLVREVIPATPEHIASQSGGHIEFNPDFVAMVIKRARMGRLSVIDAHTHPFSTRWTGFSGVDNYWEPQLFDRIRQRVPGIDHAALVFGRGAFQGRVRSASGEIMPISSIRVVGQAIVEHYPAQPTENRQEPVDETYSRQVLALSIEGQRKIQRVKVGVVGVGGTGSHVVQQLAQLGVSKFVLVDANLIEESNRSRVVGSRPADSTMSRPKVIVMKQLVKGINRESQVICIEKMIDSTEAIAALRNADVVFCCTDNLASRGILNAFAYQYLVPVVDMGVEVQPDEEGTIRRVSGRVTVLLPDGACLRCLDILDPEKVRGEIEEDQRLSYLGAEEAPSPAVISLNGVVASLAVTEFLQLVTNFARRQGERVYWMYDGLKGVVRHISTGQGLACVTCQRFLALGDNANPNDWLYDQSSDLAVTGLRPT